uniref:PX domain-containing protein n=1 Tax=Oryzias sinensis TaxID=183150 RepID=A0A8C7YDC4_9TELE
GKGEETSPPMITVSIPSLEKEVDESGKSRKLFRVEVLFNERKHYVLRRNGDFQSLHKKLKKIINTPDFPSKRNPHLRTKPMEQRRQELQVYVQVTSFAPPNGCFSLADQLSCGSNI